MQNIELKARYSDLNRAHRLCESLYCEDAGYERQTDTYFVVSNGRLKLRECTSSGNRLIYYQRNDEALARASEFHLVPVEDAVTLRFVLTQVLPVLITVHKTRHLYLLDSLRIHLDQVERLGSFVELEYVLDERGDTNHGHEVVSAICQKLGVQPVDIIPESYSDLLLRTGRL